jgi:ubiquinone/menaquinone biosynthesis C-methylase UbiE
LTRINSQSSNAHASQPGKILDCGAGGAIPPLALFHQHGFETWGIDISLDELEKARQFCTQAGIELGLKQGDMRSIPFEDQSFDFVYEHYSMCHLDKRDTAVAVNEMWRVLKPGGLCFLGVISTDSWPHSLFGEERAPGEFYGEEGGVPNVLHSLLRDQEMDEIVSPWTVLAKEKHVQYLRQAAAETSMEEWMRLYPQAEDGFNKEEWQAKYASRMAMAFRYCHLYYFLKRPA